jgi:hypothetical protein
MQAVSFAGPGGRKFSQLPFAQSLTKRLIHPMLVAGYYRKYLSLPARAHRRGAQQCRAFERIGLELFVEPAAGVFVRERFPHIVDSLALAEASERAAIMLAGGTVFRPHLERSP